MKSILFILLISIAALGCTGQNAFFKNMESSRWLSASDITDSIIENTNQLVLKQIKLPNDSLKKEVSVWDFKAGLLTISYGNFQQKTETKIAAYKYTVNHHKGILTLYIHHKAYNFIVGITSTGNHAVLLRMQKR